MELLTALGRFINKKDFLDSGKETFMELSNFSPVNSWTIVLPHAVRD
jgi:hypothetical protein